jgi:hypothetical protein
MPNDLRRREPTPKAFGAAQRGVRGHAAMALFEKR